MLSKIKMIAEPWDLGPNGYQLGQFPPGWSEWNDIYRNKGVAFCPHCDGPLFKGKRVAVIGGGNSGVGAAIDLAGIVAHVTLIELNSKLRADAVLQEKLQSLPNVSIITSAMTTEVYGDGDKVTGLTYQDRTRNELFRLDLGRHLRADRPGAQHRVAEGYAGAHSAWRNRGGQPRRDLAPPACSPRATPPTAPYKQIVISMGDGAKAALSAFDYLIPPRSGGRTRRRLTREEPSECRTGPPRGSRFVCPHARRERSLDPPAPPRGARRRWFPLPSPGSVSWYATRNPPRPICTALIPPREAGTAEYDDKI